MKSCIIFTVNVICMLPLLKGTAVQYTSSFASIMKDMTWLLQENVTINSPKLNWEKCRISAKRIFMFIMVIHKGYNNCVLCFLEATKTGTG